MTASGADETVLAVDGEFTVTGPLEGFANAGGVHVARALLAEFSTNLARLVAERAAPAAAAPVGDTGEAPGEPPGGPQITAAPPPPPSPQPAAELSAGRLLWRALLSWLGSLFGRGKP